jgi:hypothetical protein
VKKLQRQQDNGSFELERLKRRQEDTTEWQKPGSKKQFLRLNEAQETFEDLDRYLKTELQEGSRAGETLAEIIQKGKAKLEAHVLDVKIADSHGWAVVTNFHADAVLAAAGCEDKDKRLKSAIKMAEQQKEAAKKPKGGTKGGGRGGGWYGGKGSGNMKGGWYGQQAAPSGPRGGCFKCGGPHFSRECPMGGQNMSPWGNEKGGKGGKGPGW